MLPRFMMDLSAALLRLEASASSDGSASNMPDVRRGGGNDTPLLGRLFLPSTALAFAAGIFAAAAVSKSQSSPSCCLGSKATSECAEAPIVCEDRTV